MTQALAGIPLLHHWWHITCEKCLVLENSYSLMQPSILQFLALNSGASACFEHHLVANDVQIDCKVRVNHGRRQIPVEYTSDQQFHRSRLPYSSEGARASDTASAGRITDSTHGRERLGLVVVAGHLHYREVHQNAV